MRTTYLLLVIVLLPGCVRRNCDGGLSLFACAQRPAPIQGDSSVSFPPFFERDATRLGASGEPVELDGSVLRAMVIAADDFLGPVTDKTPCAERPEAHRFRLLRQGEVIFIRIDEDPSYCGQTSEGLDSGASYAIGRDGRILRRAIDGAPAEPPSPKSPSDDGGVPAPPGVSPEWEALKDDPLRWLPPELRDGGPSPVPPAGPPAGLDGGAPAAP